MNRLENRITKLEQKRTVSAALCTDQERAAIERALVDSLNSGDWSLWDKTEREYGVTKCHAVWKEMMAEVI